MMTFENYQKVTREELENAYIEAKKWFEARKIHRPFDKYAECFWILFDDGGNSYMWAIDTVCACYPECNRVELEKTLDRYI